MGNVQIRRDIGLQPRYLPRKRYLIRAHLFAFRREEKMVCLVVGDDAGGHDPKNFRRDGVLEWNELCEKTI